MQYSGFFIDLDGTMFLGDEVIEGAKQFIDDLYAKKIPYLFITNNSTYTINMIVEKLNRFNIKARPEQIITSATAVARYIKRKNSKSRCFVIGEIGLIEAFKSENIPLADNRCDYVIVGLDRKITYEKLATASFLIREGAQFVITNSDKAIPTEIGLLPGNGSIAAAITASTGMIPICAGKPEPIIMEEAIKKIGMDRKNILMVGDNYETDIKAGMNAGIDTLMVLTGYSSREELEQKVEQPTYVKENLHEWLDRKKLKNECP